MQEQGLQVALKGSVLPQGSRFVDLGEKPLQTTINQINHNPGDENRAPDDCEFYVIKFPDDYSKTFQTFLPTKAEYLLHQIIDFFAFRYGKNVMLDQVMPAAFAIGDVVKFKVEG